MLESRIVPLPPDPLLLARALGQRRSAFLLWDATGRSPAYLGCDPLASSEQLDPEPAGPPQHRGDLSSVPRWVGWLPYEAMRELEQRTTPDARPAPHIVNPCWWRFGAVAEVTDVVRIVGDDRRCIRDLERTLRAGGRWGVPVLKLLAPPEPAGIHEARIRQALEWIRAGDVYQVNLARRFRLSVSGHPMALLASLGARSRFPYCAALRMAGIDMVSTSPELFLKTDARRRLLTAPIKGTRPRGSDAATDRHQRAELSKSEKEAAELTMILDVERNDLGRVAEVGSVRLLQRPSVTTYPTLHHRAALLGARLRSDCDLETLLRAMLPSGSVTGAPKVRAMQLIAQLEGDRRGLYTGAFGTLSHARELTLAMAIRTLTVREGEGHYFAGGGIVADSDPAQEVQETHWKGLQLLPNSSSC